MLTLPYTSWCEVWAELEPEGFLKDIVLCQLVPAAQACLVEIRDSLAALVQHITCLLSLLSPISGVKTMGPIHSPTNFPGHRHLALNRSQVDPKPLMQLG